MPDAVDIARPIAARASARWRRAAAVVLLATLIVARCPQLLTAPRFWAEEGGLFFRDALALGFWHNLIHPQLGYLNLATSLSTSCASLLPLEWAPTFTTWFAFGVQLGVAALPLCIVAPATATWPRALFVAAMVLLLSPGEIWLTSTNLHYWLGVAAWFVLRDERIDGGGARWTARALLLVAGLSGVQACFLAPLFLLRAFRSRARERWLQAGILCTTACVQGVVLVVSAVQQNAELGTRFAAPGFSWLVLAFNHFVVPILGYEASLSPPLIAFDAWFHGAAAQLGLDLPQGSLVVGLLLTMVPCLWLVLTQVRRGEGREAWCTWPLVIVLSTLGSLHFAGGFRYAFGPNVFFATMLAATVAHDRPRAQRVVAIALMAAGLASNLYGYRDRVQRHADVVWAEEVRQWRQDPAHDPRIWPDGWRVVIPR